MGLLRNSKVSVCVPDEKDLIRYEFLESVTKDEKQIISNENGKKIGERIVKRTSLNKLSPEVLENRGIDYRLFSIENQVNSGVAPSPLGSFGSPSLEERSLMSDYVENQIINDKNEE